MTEPLRGSPSPLARRSRGILGRGGRGDRLGAALGQRARPLAPALLSLVPRRPAQHLLERARPPCRARPRRAAGADLRQPGHRPEASSFTYRELRDEVARLAGALAGARASSKGDRVLIYMPMVPEAVMAMLACARIGAIHSVVFGGFAAPELATRIDDAKPKLDPLGLLRRRARPHRRLQAAARPGDRARAGTSPRPASSCSGRMLAASWSPGRDRDWARGGGGGARRRLACRSRRPIRSTSSTPRARPASPRASCATMAATPWRSTGRWRMSTA